MIKGQDKLNTIYKNISPHLGFVSNLTFAALSLVEGGAENTFGLIILTAAFVFIYSSFVPGKYSGTPMNFLNFMFLKRFNMINYTQEEAIQYKLKAAGNVIHTGTDINGNM